MTVKAVGLDLAKDVFQVHGTSATGRRIFNKKIKRAKLLAFLGTLPRCIVGMEACGAGAIHLIRFDGLSCSIPVLGQRLVRADFEWNLIADLSPAARILIVVFRPAHIRSRRV